MTNDAIILRIGLLTTSWLKMKKIMAWVILAKEILTKQIKKPTSDNLEKLINVELLEKAANTIIKMAKLKSFQGEVRVLNANSDSRVEMSKLSNLYKIKPFLVSNVLLRVNGKLGESRLLHSETHLTHLPKKAT